MEQFLDGKKDGQPWQLHSLALSILGPGVSGKGGGCKTSQGHNNKTGKQQTRYLTRHWADGPANFKLKLYFDDPNSCIF